MLKFQVKRNEQFECELKLEGIQYQSLQRRLILIPDGDKKLQFDGQYKDAKCFIPVFLPDTNAKKVLAILEVVIDNKEYIRPWSAPYEILNIKILVSEAKVVPQKPKKKELENIPPIKNIELCSVLETVERKKKEKNQVKLQKDTRNPEYLDENMIDDMEYATK